MELPIEVPPVRQTCPHCDMDCHLVRVRAHASFDGHMGIIPMRTEADYQCSTDMLIEATFAHWLRGEQKEGEWIFKALEDRN